MEKPAMEEPPANKRSKSISSRLSTSAATKSPESAFIGITPKFSGRSVY